MREYGWTQQRADSMLALVAMAWGSSYLLMKIGLDGIPPFCIIALRFGIASPECFEYSADDDRHLSADSAAVTGVPQR